jgi:hypothetical protein
MSFQNGLAENFEISNALFIGAPNLCHDDLLFIFISLSFIYTQVADRRFLLHNTALRRQFIIYWYYFTEWWASYDIDALAGRFSFSFINDFVITAEPAPHWSALLPPSCLYHKHGGLAHDITAGFDGHFHCTPWRLSKHSRPHYSSTVQVHFDVEQPPPLAR